MCVEYIFKYVIINKTYLGMNQDKGKKNYIL